MSWANRQTRGDWLRARLRERGLSGKQFADEIKVDEDTVTRWLKGRHPKPAWVSYMAPLYREQADGGTPITLRDIRWHFALAGLADRVAKVVDPRVVLEAADLLRDVCTCAYERTRAAVAAGELDPVLLLHAGSMGTALLRCTGAEGLDRLSRHGASVGFIADVACVEEAWARALPSDASLPGDVDLRTLAMWSPRLRKGEKHFSV